MQTLPIKKIRPDEDQARAYFDKAALKTLTDSIKTRGVLVPVLVYPDDQADDSYILFDGERRWRAANEAKLKEIPAIVVNKPTGDRQFDQLVVNNNREPLRNYDLARILHYYHTNQGYNLRELVKLAGDYNMKFSQAGIDGLLAIMQLPDWLQRLFANEAVRATDARLAVRVCQYKDVEDKLKEEIKRQSQWGFIDDVRFKRAIENALLDTTIDLTKTSEYNTDPVFFDHKKACVGCTNRIKSSEYHYFCLDKGCFDTKQTQAKEAGLGPGGTKPKPKAKPTSKPGQPLDDYEKRNLSNEEKREANMPAKVTEYLHRHTIIKLAETVPTLENTGTKILHATLTWAAANYPGKYGGAAIKFPAEEHAGLTEGQPISLQDVFNQLETPVNPHMSPVFNYVLTTLGWYEIRSLGHLVWGMEPEHIVLFWSLDDTYLKLFRKAELIELAGNHKIDVADCPRASDIRNRLIQHADTIGVPPLIAEAWTYDLSHLEPYSWRTETRWDGDDEPDEEDDTDGSEG